MDETKKHDSPRDSLAKGDILAGESSCSGYRMIESLEIRNFRSFERLKLSGLKRMNLISGGNGTGKTAFLEAVLLGVRAMPNVVQTITQSRGMPPYNASNSGLPFVPNPVSVPIQTADQFRLQWDHLFNHWKTNQTISIRYEDSDDKKYGLDLRYASNNEQGQTVLSTGNAFVPFLFERMKDGKPERTITLGVGPQGQIIHDVITEPLGPVAAFFPSNAFHAEWDNVGWFSKLSAINREPDAIKLIHEYFPEIDSLAILSPPWQPEAIWGQLQKEKMPIALISSGLHRFMSVMLACLSYSKGIILIDEIENGVYYENYGKFWSALYETAVKNDNQIFVSSHSLECLRAAAFLIRGHERDFCLLRGAREEGESVITSVSGKLLASALSGAADVR